MEDKRDLIFIILRYYYFRNNKIARDQTINVYQNKITRLYKLLKIDNITSTKEFEDFEKMKEFFEKTYKNLNSRNTYLSSLLVWFNALYIDKKLLKKYKDYLFNNSKENKIIQKTKTEHDILKINKKILDEIEYRHCLRPFSNENSKEYLIFQLYSGEFVAPVRTDYNKMKIVKEYKEELSNKFNYYDVKNKQFIFKNYKTCRHYGNIFIDIPPKLLKILNMAIQHIASADGFLFVVEKTQKPYTPTGFSKLVKKVFEGATIGDLRKYYLSERFSKLQDVLRVLKKTTREMMNSPGVAISHYIYEEMEINHKTKKIKDF